MRTEKCGAQRGVLFLILKNQSSLPDPSDKRLSDLERQFPFSQFTRIDPDSNQISNLLLQTQTEFICIIPPNCYLNIYEFEKGLINFILKGVESTRAIGLVHKDSGVTDTDELNLQIEVPIIVRTAFFRNVFLKTESIAENLARLYRRSLQTPMTSPSKGLFSFGKLFFSKKSNPQITLKHLVSIAFRGMISSKGRIAVTSHKASPMQATVLENALLPQSRAINTTNNSGLLLFLPYLTIGGGEKVFETVSKAAVESGRRLTIVTTVGLPDTHRHGSSFEQFAKITDDIIQLPKEFASEDWLTIVCYLIQMRSIGTCLIGGSSFAYNILPQLKSIWPNLRIIDQLFNEVGHAPSNRKFSDFIDVTIVENQKVFDYLVSTHHEDPQKVVCLPNGVDVSQFVPIDKQASLSKKKSFNISSEIVITFIGRLSPEKGCDQFLRILEKLDRSADWSAVVAGDGKDWDKLIALRKSLNLEDKVAFLGFQSPQEILGLSSIVVVPSIQDGRPNVILESLAMGIPVVASKVGGIPELIEDGVVGFLCEANDLDAFSKAIEKLCYGNLFERFGPICRSKAEECFSSRSFTESYVKVLFPVKLHDPIQIQMKV